LDDPAGHGNFRLEGSGPENARGKRSHPLRGVTLSDEETVHNAFLDRNFGP